MTHSIPQTAYSSDLLSRELNWYLTGDLRGLWGSLATGFVFSLTHCNWEDVADVATGQLETIFLPIFIGYFMFEAPKIKTVDIKYEL